MPCSSCTSSGDTQLQEHNQPSRAFHLKVLTQSVILFFLCIVSVFSRLIFFFAFILDFCRVSGDPGLSIQKERLGFHCALCPRLQGRLVTSFLTFSRVSHQGLAGYCWTLCRRNLGLVPFFLSYSLSVYVLSSRVFWHLLSVVTSSPVLFVLFMPFYSFVILGGFETKWRQTDF